jgi:hexosaminidase
LHSVLNCCAIFQESKEIVYPESNGNNAPPSGSITELVIKVKDSTTGSTKINLGIDESYKLEIAMDRHSVYLNAQTWVGMLRGLETFSQLVQPMGYDLVVTCVPITIDDAPRFPWRGLLLDTSRHFQPVWSIKRVLDAMSYNKLNVFHWHLIDAESFPLVLKSHPELAAKGAWNQDSIYTPSDVAEVIQYAFSRGIRVVPEADTPGHTYSWRHADPKMILNCAKLVTRAAYPGINSIALDMTYDNTYTILKDVYNEMASLFSDSYVHVGGDEVIAHCLDEFPRIKQWMQENLNGSTNYKDLLRYFRFRLSPMITEAKKKMIVWQEAFEEMEGQPNNPLLPSNTIVQVWKNENFTDAVRASLSSRFPTLVSSGWYLDQQIPSPDKTIRYLYEDTWKDFYAIEPLAGVDDVPGAAVLMLGGEVWYVGRGADQFFV